MTHQVSVEHEQVCNTIVALHSSHLCRARTDTVQRMHCQNKHVQSAYMLHNETIAERLETVIMQALSKYAVQSAYMLHNQTIAEWLDAQLGQ